MSIPGSGPLSMSMFRTEWGGPTPTPISWFYGKSGLPGSGTIKFSDFYGKSAIAVAMPNFDLTDVQPTANASGTVRLNTNGTYQGLEAATQVQSGNFVTPTTEAAQVEVRATLTTAPSGAGVWSGSGFGSWLAVNATRSWVFTLAAMDSEDTSTITLEFRIVGTGTVIDTSVHSIGLTKGTPP